MTDKWIYQVITINPRMAEASVCSVTDDPQVAYHFALRQQACAFEDAGAPLKRWKMPAFSERVDFNTLRKMKMEFCREYKDLCQIRLDAHAYRNPIHFYWVNRTLESNNDPKYRMTADHPLFREPTSKTA
jgi:hypothetical protein